MFDPIYPEYSEFRKVNLSQEAFQKASPFSPKEWVIYYIQGRPGGLPADTVKSLRLALMSYEMKYLVHIPDIITENLKEQIAYNFPWVDTSVADITEMAFYKAAAKRLGVTLDDEHGYFVRYNPKTDDMDYVMVSGDSPEELVPELVAFLGGSVQKDNITEPTLAQSSDACMEEDMCSFDYRFEEEVCAKKKRTKKNIFNKIIWSKEESTPDLPVACESVCQSTIDKDQDFLSRYSSYETLADQKLPVDMKQAEKDAHALIRTLLMNNFDRDIIKGWLIENVKISDVVITPAYKIFLPEYQNKEVKLTPLEKTIWLFYIKHPEGVSFKDLPSYEKEMMSIYEKLAKRDDIESMRTSISDLCDPFKDSISQKVAKVRAAFITAMPEEIARNYFISGPLGQEKRIPLDRAKIKIQAKL